MPSASTSTPAPAPDVVVLGEVLVERSSLTALRDGATVRLGFSGDGLNVAPAAAAAGAHIALVARVPEDALGDELVERAAELGVDTSRIVRAPGQHGLYLSHADPHGERQFVDVRAGSAGSGLCREDLDEAFLRAAGVGVASAVACAVSASAAETVLHAARISRRFVYDPNFRPPVPTVHETQTALAAARTTGPMT